MKYRPVFDFIRKQGVRIDSVARVAKELYTVQPGDTLRTIAQSYYGDPERYSRVFEANREAMRNEDDLRPGQRLTIPLEDGRWEVRKPTASGSETCRAATARERVGNTSIWSR